MAAAEVPGASDERGIAGAEGGEHSGREVGTDSRIGAAEEEGLGEEEG